MMAAHCEVFLPRILQAVGQLRVWPVAEGILGPCERSQVSKHQLVEGLGWRC